MASPSRPDLFFSLLASLLLISVASAHEYRVGGSTGWAKPLGNESESYGQWAKRHRFHVGDSLHFLYEKDSVLVVDRDDYAGCNTTTPIQAFIDGNTTIRFDRYGFFCFISGEPGHCEAGEKLIVRVMVHPEFVAASPGPAPFAQPGRGGGGPSSSSSSGPSGSESTSGSLKVNGGYNVVVVGIVAILIAFMIV